VFNAKEFPLPAAVIFSGRQKDIGISKQGSLTCSKIVGYTIYSVGNRYRDWPEAIKQPPVAEGQDCKGICGT